MARLLHLKATPRNEESRTMQLAAAFLDSYKEANPGDEIETLDLFTAALPEFDKLTAEGKYRIMRGLEHTAEEAVRWAEVEAVIEHFSSFDKYLLTCPMWNFSIPYRLKLYLDIIVQPTYTFAVDAAGNFSGLLTGRSLMLLATRGGDYGENSPAASLDFQIPYVQTIFGFMGISVMPPLVAQPLDLAGEEVCRQAMAEAMEQVKAAASAF